MPRLYFDNAATSFPKPEAVHDAVDAWSRGVGTPVGRGAYSQAIETQRIVDRCRKGAADRLGAGPPERVAFAFNGTDALNLAIHGTLEPGDHVVTTEIEHNSVLRPLRECERRLGVAVTRLPADRTGRIEAAAVRAALRPETKLVCLTHASNVTGTIQPVADVAAIVRAHGALFLVDAAQTAGHLPLDVRGMSIDLLACPGHKGLLGPLGTGLLAISTGVEERLRSVRQGGTGSRSEDDRQPESLPDKYESGNHNAPGLVGLEAALAWLADRGVESIRAHEIELVGRLLDGLRSIRGLTIHGPADADERTGVVSVEAEGFDPQVLAALLDESFGLQTRAGLHCAPGAHRAIGSFDRGGTVRLSPGPFTTPDEVDLAVHAFRELCG